MALAADPPSSLAQHPAPGLLDISQTSKSAPNGSAIPSAPLDEKTANLTSQTSQSATSEQTPQSQPQHEHEQAQPTPKEVRSYSSSPRQFPTELNDAIPEEACETESESAEPVTPVSRHSQHFENHEDHHPQDLQPETLTATETQTSTRTKASLAPETSNQRTAVTPSPSKVTSNEQEPTPATLSRRTTFSRAVSSLFKRSSSQLSQQGAATDLTQDSPSNVVTASTPVPARTTRRGSQNPSSTTTRSNSPPSPSSPLEMTSSKVTVTNSNNLPGPDDFNERQKNRSSTGLTLRGRAVKFVGRGGGRPARRAASFDAGVKKIDETPQESHWALHPDAGTGTKARRMSLSLPDDFTVDVSDLMTDYEYLSKFFGRHGRHLGKGAASKVTLMARKGFPSELYAVKEFRAKSKNETKEEYENKIKSEFSIAKSLHHPNIVETVSLCTNHGRWNHVMEYCSEGDLFGLVNKRYLHLDSRQEDRLCLFKQLIQGVNYLHTHGIAHRDIKLENLLVTKDSKLKITDFGVSEVFCGTHPGLREAGGQCGKNMDEKRLCSPGICGSMPYIAPEVLTKKDSYDPRALDVWGSAVIMIHLTFGGAIWNKAEPGELNYDSLAQAWEKWNSAHKEGEEITDHDYPYCKAMGMGMKPPALRRIMLEMLNPNPAKRLTISEVANHRWFKGIDCCQLESYDEPSRTIDASKCSGAAKRIKCHNHLPPKNLETTLIGNGKFD